MISCLASLIGFDPGAVFAYADIISSVIGTFAVAASMTPNKVDDKILGILLDVVNFLGFNIGRAKNA